MYRFCFRGGGGDALSALPAADGEEAASFFERRDSQWVAVPRSVALRHEFQAELEHVPANRCPHRCGERGACLARAGRRGGRGFCKCDPHYSGKACAQHSSRWCWNDCAGRGTCVDGWCRCRPPFYGPGCAFDGSRPQPPAAAPHGAPPRGPFRVYVYDLPPLVLRRRTFGSDPDPIFNTHHVFLERLLIDPAALATRPEEAHAFLAPAFGTNMEALDEYYVHVQLHIAARLPWWHRRRGTDHAWFTTADGGGCNLNTLPRLRRSVIMAHYLKWNTTATGCGVRGKDLALPPAVPGVLEASFLARGAAPLSSRPLRFFFAGNVPDSEQPGFDQIPDAQLGREAYSEGVRQLVWKHARQAPGFRVVSRSASYLTDWSESQVCLAPMGVGWGVRLLWSLGGGCVPLLASSEVAGWFDDALNYSTFSLHALPKETLTRLPSYLQAVGTPRLQALQRGVLRHRRLFLWGASDDTRGHGSAYQVTMQQLCRRATRHRIRSQPAMGYTAMCDAQLPAALAAAFPALTRPPQAAPDAAPPPSREGGGRVRRRAGAAVP